MKSKLIFVEGQPGSGKSTISQFISHQLNLNGESVYWVDEYEHDGNDFIKFWENYENSQEDIVNVLINCWIDLIEKIKISDKICVMDSAYFSYTLYLLNLEISKSKIQDYFKTLNRLLAVLKPKIIFLKGDTKTIISRACERRGHIWTDYTIEKIEQGPYQKNRNRTGFKGMIEYFSDGQDLYFDLLPLSKFPILQLDVTEENWSTNENVILSWLGYTKIKNQYTLNKKDIEKYLGKYQVPNDFPAKGEELEIIHKDDVLTLMGKFWKDYKLIPRSQTDFLISGIPMGVRFRMKQDGKVSGFDYTFIDRNSYYCVKIS